MLRKALVKDWSSFSDRVGDDFGNGNPLTDRVLGALRGDEWKRMRSIITPTFTSSKMKHMFGIMAECCHLLVKNLSKRIGTQPVDGVNCDTNDPVDGAQALVIDFRHPSGCYSMDVIAKCCFGTQTNSFDDPNDTFVKHVNNFFNVPLTKVLMYQFTPRWMTKLIGFGSTINENLDFLAHVTRTVIERRLNSEGPSLHKKDYDYLHLLIEASNDNEVDAETSDTDHESHHGHETSHESESIRELEKQRHPLTTDDIIANSINFLTVGYHNTSFLISFTIHNLCVYQDVQERLYQELKSISAKKSDSESAKKSDSDSSKNGGPLFDYESISGSKYLDAIISETLRLYPPGIWIERKVVGNGYTFTENNITIPKGGSIRLPIYNLHHDSRYWPEPEKFDPNRFLPKNKDKIVPYTYLPFGAGPRNCIGMRFALLEAKLAVAHLVMNFKFSPDSKTDIPLDVMNSSFLLSPKRLIVKIVKRMS